MFFQLLDNKSVKKHDKFENYWNFSTFRILYLIFDFYDIEKWENLENWVLKLFLHRSNNSLADDSTSLGPQILDLSHRLVIPGNQSPLSLINLLDVLTRY